MFLSNIFNITPSQWSRVSECWLLTFFFKLGSAIGWTILTAGFVGHYGIASLPVLFVINAIFIMLSTYFFEQIIMRIKREVLMIIMILMAAICLFFASFIYDKSPAAFFALLILAESVFLAQFNVFIPILVGDRFTPLESQRTFPFIESAETVAGTIGGVFLGVFGSRLPLTWFLYAWIIFLACIIFVFIITSYVRGGIPPLLFAPPPQGPVQSPEDDLRTAFASFKKIPFLKGLMVVVLLQWVFMNILEFQYTKAVSQSVTHTTEATIASVAAQSLSTSVLSSPSGVADLLSVRNAAQEPVRTLSVKEQSQLTQKLGSLKGIFYAGALVVQILLASRLITSLGIVGSLLLHPVMMLMSLVGMFLKFGFSSSVIAKLNFETTNVIHKNAYFTSHYALPKAIRDQAAEFLEGIVRPLGTVIGMLFILGFQMIFSGRDLSMWIHLVMFVIMAWILFSTIRLQPKYTKLTREQLFSDLPYPEKLNAIEILTQKGHKDAPMILVQKLEHASHANSQESPEVRIRLLAALGEYHDYATLKDIVNALYDSNPDVRLEAAHALMNFRDIGEKFYTQSFSRYRVLEALKEIFRRETSAAVRGAIIRVFSLLRQPDIVAFLLEVLRDEASDVRADCIYTLGLFRDPTVTYYIAPFLDDKNLNVRANAIIALWHFPQFRVQLEDVLTTLLQSADADNVRAGLYAAGEIDAPELHELHRLLTSSDSELQLEAAFALTKRGDFKGCSVLLDHLLTMPPAQFETMRRFFHRLNPRAQKVVEQTVVNTISEEMSKFSRLYSGIQLHEMEYNDLEKLKRLYTLLSRHEELYALEMALQKRIEREKN